MENQLNNIRSTADIFNLHSTPSVPAEKYQSNLYKQENKQVLDYLLVVRKLKLQTLKYFKIGATEINEVSIPIFKDSKLIDYKFRNIKDKVFKRYPGSETWIINEDAIFSSIERGYLIVTEGEFDAMSVWQIGYKNVISSTGGAQNDKTTWVERIPENVKVYINYDNDEPGQEAARKLADKIGLDRCYNVILPTKDANDFIKEGHTSEEYGEILKNSKRFEIKDVFKLSDVILELENNKVQRATTFLNRFNNYTNGGIPKKSLIVLSGRSGVGKSTILMNFLIDHADHNKSVILISLENDIYSVVQRLLEIKYKQKIQDWTKNDWLKRKSELVDYPFYIDMSMNRYSMRDISKVANQAKKLYGIEFLGFDHIGWLPNRSNSVGELSQMVMDFKLLARENDIIVYLISHIRKVDPSIPITGEDLKGTSSLQQDADMVLLLYHTKKGLELSIDKARMSASHLSIPITFNGVTGVITDDMSRNVTSFGEEVDYIYEEHVVIPVEEKNENILDII